MLGFVRDAVIAALFGSDATTDAFFIAFRIPNFLRRLFAEGSFSQAFVPALTVYKDTRSRPELVRFLDHSAGSLAAIAVAMTVTGILTAPLLVLVFAPGFWRDPQLLALCAEMVQVTFPYVGLITLTAFCGSVLNAYGQFAVPALTPALLNLTMIVAAVAIAPLVEQPILALGWSVTIAGILQLLMQLPALYRKGLLPRPRWGFGDPDVRRIFVQLGPTVLSSSVTQINVLLNTLIGSFLVTGSISWLYYSDRLVEFPVGLLGVAIGTVMLPHLAQSHAAKDAQRFSNSLDWSMRLVLVAAVPATVGLILCAKPLLFSLFQYDQFSPDDVEMTSRSLMTYALGIVGYVAVRALLSGFTARHDFRTPFRFGIAAIAVNLLSSAVLARIAAPFGWGHAALGLGTSLGSLVNSGLLLWALLQTGVYRPLPGWRVLLLRVAVACIAMGTLLWVLDPGTAAWRDWQLTERFTRLLLLVGAGALAYGASLWVLGLRPTHLRIRHGT